MQADRVGPVRTAGRLWAELVGGGTEGTLGFPASDFFSKLARTASKENDGDF